ncbi:MAG: glycoside hydrolase family 38 C-terminal domain-containing protein, partial [Candidatus Heimdallarchaeota archaeon]
FIVPHTHWDREWYLPFQEFRFELVKLIDELLELNEKEEFKFTFDGQTIVIEDYLEIRPENENKFLDLIKKGTIMVGPWYLLPDEWLVGQESLIRNLEYSIDLAEKYNLPLMDVAYLPDQFGHTKAIPQLLRDVTHIKTAVIWRGVGPEIDTIPFYWKSHPKAKNEILTIYMPGGYGNAAHLPAIEKQFLETVKQKIADLDPFSPIPVYLLMNGTDHQHPQKHVLDFIKKLTLKNTTMKLANLNEFVDRFTTRLQDEKCVAPIYHGEFRSPARAPLLQDTYSTRMWIKLWDNKIEDMLVHYAEPINSYLWHYLKKNYPTSYLSKAWSWLLKNQPHDSICGCSVDETHDEMIARYSWAETIAKTNINEALKILVKNGIKAKDIHLLVFNPTNSNEIPLLMEFTLKSDIQVNAIEDENGNEFEVYPISSSDEIIFEATMRPFMIKQGLGMLPGRKLMDFYINDVNYKETSDPDTLLIEVLCGDEPIGEFNPQDMLEEAREIIDSKKYKKFHIKVTKGTTQTYAAIAPVKSFGFSNFTLKPKKKSIVTESISCTKNSIENSFYTVKFRKDGTFSLEDKQTNMVYKKLHIFEDFGDRGDEYTFGRVQPNYAKPKRVKRKIKTQNNIMCEIEQEMKLELFEEINEKRDKRIGKVEIPVTTVFRFYRDSPRIDIQTELTNKSKDHRLRICYDMPFSTKYTFTSTHFGVIKRKGDPIELEEYLEMPSGIQAQKRFTRVDDDEDDVAFTLTNKGLPEVELVKGSRLALTLVRSTGYLSRSDYPERPIHAGPFLATPGAQEMNTEYQFSYSILAHSADEPMTYSADNAEIATLQPKCMLFDHSKPPKEILKPLLVNNNSQIRISSLRVRNENIWVTMFNLSDVEEETTIEFSKNFTECTHIQLDGVERKKLKITNEKCKVTFDPFEIKILKIK